MSDVLEVSGGRPLRGRVRVPGDKSISHRALLLAAVAEGRSRLAGLSDGEDVARTAAIVGALGATVSEAASGDRSGRTVEVLGDPALAPPAGPLDCGNSGTTMRLVAGLVASHPLEVVLEGDESLSGRPMDRVAVPLRAMGAAVAGRGDRCLPPLAVTGGRLHGIDYTPPQASAQVKSCVLLAGLGAEGVTVVREPVATRPHTEELLALAGARVAVAVEDGRTVVRLEPSPLRCFDLEVPADPSQAAFWVVAATVVAGSEVVVEGVYAGAGRRGFLDVLGRMGAAVEETPVGTPGTMAAVSDLRVRAAALTGTEVAAAEITGLDEVPALAVAAAVARGTTVFRDVGELRVKESDRLAGVVALVQAFGGEAEARGDDLVVRGVDRLQPAEVDAGGDHRMAMAAAVAALACEPEGPGGPSATTIRGWQATATSYPGFAAHLRMLAGFAEREVGA